MEERVFGPDGDDQLFQYANDLSALLTRHEALADSHRELENLYRQVLDALDSEKTDTARTLRDALVQAESARLAKQTFLANMSHELRTPLNAIIGLSFVASRRTAEPKTRAALDQIAEAGQKLLGMVSDVLDTANIEAGQLQVESVVFSLTGLIQKIRDDYGQQAAAKGIRIDLQLDPGLPQSVCGDSLRIGQVLRNLVGNAIKFSTDSPVAIRVKSLRECEGVADLLIEIEDHGIGISEADQKRIFELFEQADGSRTRRFGGAGLGLSVCRLLLRLMGGELGFNSAPERGSLFWITLHLPVVVRAKAVAAEAVAGRRDADAFLNYLRRLLASKDFRARLLCDDSGKELHAALGERAQPVLAAIELFDFEAALSLLDNARAPATMS